MSLFRQHAMSDGVEEITRDTFIAEVRGE